MHSCTASLLILFPLEFIIFFFSILFFHLLRLCCQLLLTSVILILIRCQNGNVGAARSWLSYSRCHLINQPNIHLPRSRFNRFSSDRFLLQLSTSSYTQGADSRKSNSCDVFWWMIYPIPSQVDDWEDDSDDPQTFSPSEERTSSWRALPIH